MSVEMLITRVHANGGAFSDGMCKAIKSLPACIRVMENAKEAAFKTEGINGRGYNKKRWQLSKLLSPERLWCLAGMICDNLYATVDLVLSPNAVREDIRQRDSLIEVLVVIIGLIYTAAYDIAPLKSWGPDSVANMLPLTPAAMARPKFKNYRRLVMFRQFFHNGVSPVIAAKLVRHWYLLQPRNRSWLPSKTTKVDRELATTMKMAKAGTGKVWTSWQDEPYTVWDVHNQEFRLSNEVS
jgi:hypothetical protein